MSSYANQARQVANRWDRPGERKDNDNVMKNSNLSVLRDMMLKDLRGTSVPKSNKTMDSVTRHFVGRQTQGSQTCSICRKARNMHAGIESSKPETKACRLDIGAPLSFLSLGIHLRSSTREKGIKADDCTGVCAVSQLHMLLQALSWHHGTHGTVCVLLLCPRPPPCGWDFPRTGRGLWS